MRAALLVLSAGMLLTFGSYLAHRAPAWLTADPLESPFGWTVGQEADSTEPAARDADPPPATPDDPVVLPLASAEELRRLPGVGPVLAARIVAHRDTVGTISQWSQLVEVKGIGPKTLERLKPVLRLQNSSQSLPDSLNR